MLDLCVKHLIPTIGELQNLYTPNKYCFRYILCRNFYSVAYGVSLKMECLFLFELSHD